MLSNPKTLFASHLAKELTLDRLIRLHEAISAHIVNHERFINDAYGDPLIQRFARSQHQYFAVMQATHDAMVGFDEGSYRLKETSPRGGIYPLIDLPSFSIISRRSNTLRAFQKANYLKNQAVKNAYFEQVNLDLFDILENPNIAESDRIFMILDVYVDNSNQAHLSFLLPSTNLQHIHLSISYEEVLDKAFNTVDEVQIQPATSKLKKTLQDLDAQLSQQ